MPAESRPAWAEEVARCVGMVGRMGAKSFSLGYLVDDPPPGAANWYASAEFRKGELSTLPMMTPVEAAEALVAMLQRDARCAWCGRAISWGERPARSENRKRCWWRKIGGRWEKGCPARRVVIGEPGDPTRTGGEVPWSLTVEDVARPERDAGHGH